MMFQRRPKRKAPPSELIKPKAMENPLYQSNDSGLSNFRRRILIISAGIVAAIIFGIAVYGPWLRIEAIAISGTRLLDPTSLEVVVNQYLDRQRWLIIPNRNVWLLSSSQAEKYLRERIEQRLAIDEITVTKQYPHQITVQVAERVPLFVWQSNAQRATVDRQGVVIELLSHDTPLTEGIPLVLDGPGRPLSVNQHLITAEALTAMQTLGTLMHERQWEIQHFVIPTPICPTVIEPEPVEPTNTNTSNSNTNAPETNTNQAVGNQNVNRVTIPQCDLAVLTKQSIEIHLKLKDGPEIYFDRHQNLVQAVEIVDQVLRDPANRQARYIDVRFGERVYIQ